MRELPEIFRRFMTQFWYFLLLPVYLFLTLIISRPFDTWNILNMDRSLFYFNCTMLMCIALVFLLITRLIFYVFRKNLAKNWLQYVGWFFLEMTGLTYFFALYLDLMSYDGFYFYYVAISLQFSFLTLLFPYFGITAICQIIHLSTPKPREHDTIRFTDANGQVKIVLLKDAIMYVKADENYIQIHYYEGGKTKSYSMRSSMVAITPLMERFDFFRCHRSYFINPDHIVALRKDQHDTFSAELDIPNITIPVSKKLYVELSKRL